jgi:hypothetical protein
MSASGTDWNCNCPFVAPAEEPCRQASPASLSFTPRVPLVTCTDLLQFIYGVASTALVIRPDRRITQSSFQLAGWPVRFPFWFYTGAGCKNPRKGKGGPHASRMVRTPAANRALLTVERESRLGMVSLRVLISFHHAECV